MKFLNLNLNIYLIYIYNIKLIYIINNFDIKNNKFLINQLF